MLDSLDLGEDKELKVDSGTRDTVWHHGASKRSKAASVDFKILHSLGRDRIGLAPGPRLQWGTSFVHDGPTRRRGTN